jgi:hypothetical protein
LEKGTLGTLAVTGSATKGAWYVIKAIDGTTVFPTGYKVGDIWQGDATKTFSATNSAYPITFTLAEDVSSWDVTFSKDAIEVTTLADGTRKYRAGKADAVGAMSGINFVDQINKAGGIANKFVRVINGDTAGNTVAVLTPVDGTPYYFRGLLQDDKTTTGEIYTFLFGKIEVEGWKAGAAVGDAQSWDSSFHFVDADPILYCLEVETPST